jgi:hypothetical protein
MNKNLLDKVVDQILSETKICFETKTVITPFPIYTSNKAFSPPFFSPSPFFPHFSYSSLYYYSFPFSKITQQYDHMSGITIGMRVHLKEVYSINDGREVYSINDGSESTNPCCEIHLGSSEPHYITNKYRDYISSKIYDTTPDKLKIIV